MSTKQGFSVDRQPTNATARLSTVLDKLAALSSAVPVADVLVSTLKTQDADPNRSFLLAFTAITRMLESSQKEVETYLSSELSFYGAHFQPLRVCFNPKNSGQPWNTYKAHLNPNDVTGIRHTAQRLKSLVPEFEATDADLADILTAIEEMSQALDTEALSKHSRETLRECIEEIRRAVNEYKIWGTAGLNRAYKVFTGTLVTDSMVQADLSKSSAEEGSLWSKVKKLGGGLMLILGILHGVHNLKQDYLPFVDRLILPQPEKSMPSNDTKANSGDSANGSAGPSSVSEEVVHPPRAISK